MSMVWYTLSGAWAWATAGASSRAAAASRNDLRMFRSPSVRKCPACSGSGRTRSIASRRERQHSRAADRTQQPRATVTRMRSLAEDRPTHTHHRRALRDRGFEIVGHAHRQRVQRRCRRRPGDPAAPAARETVPAAAPDRRWAAESSSSPRSARPGNAATARASASTSAGGAPLLLSSPLEVDLQADLQRRQGGGTGLAQALRDLEPIDAVHPVESARRCRRVLLLWIGPMKCHSMARSSRLLHLVERLLDIVLAEGALPGRPGRAQGRRGEGLAHRDQAHGRGIAAGRPRRGLDAGEDCLQRLWDRGHNARVSGHRICLLLCPPRPPVR